MVLQDRETGLYADPYPDARPVVAETPPFIQSDADAEHGDVWGGHVWPARWIQPAAVTKPHDALFRRRFTLSTLTRVRVHVSGDERYELRLDGRRVGRGPHRGDPQRWAFETYDLVLPAGEHTLLAWVSSPGADASLAPSAQRSVDPGFLLSAEGTLGCELNTGSAAWETRLLHGITHVPPTQPTTKLAGGTVHVDGRAVNWEHLAGRGDGWQPAEPGAIARYGGSPWGQFETVRPLVSSNLPSMMEQRFTGSPEVRYVGPDACPVDFSSHKSEQAAEWDQLVRQDEPLTFPAHTTRVVVIDLHDYVCAYPVLQTDRGRDATIRIDWAEALYIDDNPHAHAKDDRNVIDGRYFRGKGDTFILDGRDRTYAPPWWRCGRYVRVKVQTADEPVEVKGLRLMETRYPLKRTRLPELSDARLQAALPLMRRAVEVCTHETFMDCPYYEQLAYVGDSRLEALVTLALTGDDRPARRCIELFGGSLTHFGLTQARYPSSTPQVIPGFSLWWVAMLHDFAQWVGAREFVARHMPVARCVIETHLGNINPDGLLGPMPGWVFADWADGWKHGVPPGAEHEPHALFNWHLAYTLERMAELEAWVGEPRLAERCRETSQRLGQILRSTFFDASSGLFADDAAHRHFSEHTQCLAVLSGLLDADARRELMHRTRTRDDLTACTIYFSHYKLEALARIGDGHGLQDVLELWRELPERGFVTTPEQPEPTRSDCHGWGGHPLYHLLANVLGIQPDGLGFERVLIRPCPGSLEHIRGEVATPAGAVHAAIHNTESRREITLCLPPSLGGTIDWQGDRRELPPGFQGTLTFDHSA